MSAVKIECPQCGELGRPGRQCEHCGLPGAKMVLPDVVIQPVSMPVSVVDSVIADYQAAQVKPSSKKSTKPIRACADCGAEKVIVGRGLCGACYPRHKKNGTLDSLYPAKQSWIKQPTMTKKKCVPIGRLNIELGEAAAFSPPGVNPAPVAHPWDFPGAVVSVQSGYLSNITIPVSERDNDLLTFLEEWAEDERRTLPQQILHLLDGLVADRARGAA